MPYTIEEKNGSIHVSSESKRTEELFIDAARALFGVLYDVSQVREDERIKIVVDAPSISALLYAWLTELIERQHIHELVFKDFSIVSIQKVNDSQYLLTGAAFGEPFDAQKHIPKKTGAVIPEQSCVCEQQEQRATCSFQIQTH